MCIFPIVNKQTDFLEIPVFNIILSSIFRIIDEVSESGRKRCLQEIIDFFKTWHWENKKIFWPKLRCMQHKNYDILTTCQDLKCTCL